MAHTPCIMPSSGKPSFQIGDDEMEIGVGHHGEPGIQRTKLMSADEVTTLITQKILEDLPFGAGDEVSILMSGLGSTSLLEMYICYRKLHQILTDHQIIVHRNYIGEYFTSMEMGGFSITLTKLDEDLKRLIDAPVSYTHLDVYKRQGIIYAVEPLGDSKIVHVLYGDKSLLIETTPDFIGSEDEKIFLKIDSDYLLLFDKETEQMVL